MGSGVLSFAAALAAHPVSFLLGINVLCAALGVFQFAYGVAMLEPADFAVIGVLTAIGGVVTGLLDVRLIDLTTKLYFAEPMENCQQRARLLSASLAVHVGAGLAIGGLVMLAGAALAPHLLERPPTAWWVAAMALRMGVALPIDALNAFVRLTGDFRTTGWLRLVTQVAVTTLTVGALAISPDLTGYFFAVAIGAVVSIGLCIPASRQAIAAKLGGPLPIVPEFGVVRAYLTSDRFFRGGSLTSLAKLLSRSCDTLLVSAMAGDATTGLYRVARQAYDSLANLVDAVEQFYTPTIVDAVSRGQRDELRKHRQRLVLIGMAAAAGSIAASWLLLRPLAAARYPQYLPALPAFEVLSGLLVVTLGVHSWLWPMLVARGHVESFGLQAIVGALAQLAAIAAMAFFGLLDAATAAAAVWVMAAVSYGPFLWRGRYDPAR